MSVESQLGSRHSLTEWGFADWLGAIGWGRLAGAIGWGDWLGAGAGGDWLGAGASRRFGWLTREAMRGARSQSWR